MNSEPTVRSHRWLLVAGLGLLVCALVEATPPLVLRHEVRVSVDLRLLLNDPDGKSREIEATVRGRAGEPLAFARQIRSAGHSLTVGLVLRVQPGGQDGLCRVEVESTVQPEGAATVETRRGGELAQGRVWLTDLWSDEDSGARLVLAAVVDWEEVPLLEAQDPERQPVDLLLGVYHKTPERLVLLERHRLSSIVGSPVEYTYRHRPGPGSGDSDGTLAIKLLPEQVIEQNLTLSVSISHQGRSIYSSSKQMAVSVTEVLPPGASVDLPLPRREDEPQLVLRITPFF